MSFAFLPSPTQNVWELGPLPIRAYAICIIAGVLVAMWITDRRWRARGGLPGAVGEIAVWAVLFGLVGGRLYHVATDPELYFGAGRHPADALRVWEGGLGIWGAIAFGALGAWIACRRRGIALPGFADAAAPAIAIAQAIGRLGNWFNNELYGRATDLPWGLKIYDIDPATHHARHLPGESATAIGTFHPTFLYEIVWNLGVAAVVFLADRRFKFSRGRAFALYVMLYTAGRFWIETLRIDPANKFFGIRLNVWTSIIVFVAALAWFVLARRKNAVSTVDTAEDSAGSLTSHSLVDNSSTSGQDAAIEDQAEGLESASEKPPTVSTQDKPLVQPEPDEGR